MGRKDDFYVDIMSMHPGVTGSCNLVIVKLPNKETLRFVVDCGLFQERENDKLNKSFPFNAQDIQFVLITHNHVDHIGRLPLLVHEGFCKSIYTSEITSHLLPLALGDSYRVLSDVSKRKHQSCLYSADDVSRTMQLVKPVNFEETFSIGEYIKVTFLGCNGHLLGAACILVQLSYPEREDINLLFTGDYNSKNIFLDLHPIPEWILDLPLTVIQESTYGNMDSSEIVPCFRKNVVECISKGGTVVCPVFSLGRAQEALYEIKCMQDEGIIDIDVPVFLDGKLAIKYTGLYPKLNINDQIKEHFLPSNLTYVDKTSRDEVLQSNQCKIVLTTSGMGSYGPAQVYIPEYLSRPKALIQFMGYTAEGTLGRKMQTAQYGDFVEIGGTIIKKAARVEYTAEFSAHGKADEMIAFLKKFNNLKLVLVNHGEPDVKGIFAERIAKEVNTKRVGILGREYFFRVTSLGLVKSLSTKFE